MLQAFFLAILNFYSIKNLLKWGSSSISGGFASCVSTFCLYPLSNMQTRLQVVYNKKYFLHNFFCCWKVTKRQLTPKTILIN